MENQYEDEIIKVNLQQIGHALKSNLIIILFAALIVCSASFAVAKFFVTPTYQAVASLYVNNSTVIGSTTLSISASELQASSSMVEAYIYLLNSRTTLEAVIADTGVDYDVDTLRKKIIKAEAVPKTAAFEVTVTSESPQEAELIANSIAKLLPERISSTIDGTFVRIVDYAIVPASKHAPQLPLIVFISFTLTLLIAVGIVVIKCVSRETRNDIIKNADDLIKTHPNLRIMTVIPDMSLAEGKGYYYSKYYGPDKKRKKGEK